MRVIIADRKPLLRDSLAALIRLAWPGTEALTSPTLAEATASMGLGPLGVLILGADQAGSGEVIRAVRLIHPGWRLALLGTLPTGGAATTFACDAHWDDDTDTAVMLGDIGRLLGRETARLRAPAAPASVLWPWPEAAPAPTEASVRNLTRRQHDVLGLLAEGRSTKEIARSLNLGVGTIKAHLDGLYRTLGVHNRTAAVHLARQLPADNVVRLAPRPAARVAMAAVG